MRKHDPYLWERLTAFSNLEAAFKKAAHESVAAFERNLEVNLPTLRRELLEGVYQPGGYISFHVHDPKKRGWWRKRKTQDDWDEYVSP